jgi:8-oxo-dGTP pyrophosphatase MutT (NUDIX family)
MNMKPWHIIRSQVLLDRQPWLRLVEQDVRLSNGRVIAGYLLAQAREYAMTFALTDQGRVPLVQQYKHGLGGLSYDLPAGYLDAGEEPLACAQRELREETGYVADDWRHLSSVVLDSNRGNTRAHLFLARGARQVAAPHLDDTEDLAARFLAPDEILAMIRSGDLDSIASVTCALLAVDVLRRP